MQNKGNCFASVSEDKETKIWNPTIKVLDSKSMETAPVRCLIYTSTDQLILGMKDCNILVKAGNSKQRDTYLKGHTRVLNSIAVTKGGVIVSGSDDTTVRLWDLAKLKNSATIKVHKEEITKVEAQETKFLSSSLDHTIRLFDIKTQKQISCITESTPANTLLFTDENNFFAGLNDGKIRSYDLRDTTKSTAVFSGHEKGVTCCQLHDFSSSLVSSSLDNTLKVWSIKKNEVLTTLEGHTDAVRACLSSGDIIISGSDDQTIKLWRF